MAAAIYKLVTRLAGTQQLSVRLPRRAWADPEATEPPDGDDFMEWW